MSGAGPRGFLERRRRWLRQDAASLVAAMLDVAPQDFDEEAGRVLAQWRETESWLSAGLNKERVAADGGDSLGGRPLPDGPPGWENLHDMGK